MKENPMEHDLLGFDHDLLAEACALRHEELTDWADSDDRHDQRQRVVAYVLGVPLTAGPDTP
jgi:hypothetical protein